MESALGGRFDGGIARRGAGARPCGPAGRPAAGFWRFRGRAQEWQGGAKGAPHPIGRERARVQAAFPGEALVRDDGARQPEVGVGQEHQPGPAIGLLRVAHPRRRPGEDLCAEADGVLLVEPPDIGVGFQVKCAILRCEEGRCSTRDAPIVPETLRRSGRKSESAYLTLVPERKGGDRETQPRLTLRGARDTLHILDSDAQLRGVLPPIGHATNVKYALSRQREDQRILCAMIGALYAPHGADSGVGPAHFMCILTGV